MRWTPLVSLFTVLAVTLILEGVFAAPLEVVLESRARVKSPPSAKSKKLNTGSLKPSTNHQKASLFEKSRAAVKSTPPRVKAKKKKSAAGSPKRSTSPQKTGKSRAAVKPTRPKANAQKLTAGSLKASSYTYRKSALSGQGTFTKVKGLRGVAKINTTPKSLKGKHADHILEAQTVAKALHKAGYRTIPSLGTQGHQAVKDILNYPGNMAFVDGPINVQKGHNTRFALSGGIRQPNAHVKAYMKQTAAAGMDTAKKIDGVLKQQGITGVSVQKEHRRVLRQMGIKRELPLEELD